MADQSVNDGLWLSLTELAQLRGVSKPAISQNLKNWKARGVDVATRMEGRTLLINVAEYDTARGEVGHSAFTQEPEREETKGSPPPSDPVFAREQAREKGYAADLKKLQLGRELSTTVATDRAEDELARVFEPIIKAIDRLPSRADDLAAAIASNGAAGVRAELKVVAADLRNEIAAGLEDLLATLRAEPRRPLTDFDPSATAP